VLNSPRRDDILLAEAGVSLDRALFPPLVRLGGRGALGVGDLAEQAGRDHSTVGRRVARLEALGLVVRQAGGEDRRVRAARTVAIFESIVIP
jgi:DNA-binding MarR family transcriptional regulator